MSHSVGHMPPVHADHRHQRGGIHEGYTPIGLGTGCDLAPPVEEDQSRGDAKTPQVDVRCAGRNILGKSVGIILSAVVDGQRLS